MAVIRIKKTPRASYDDSRPPSSLLLNQIKHLEWAVLPAAARRARASTTPKIRTEAEAAARIAQLTKMLFEATERATVAPAAVTLPPRPMASTPARPAKTSKTARAAKAVKAVKTAKAARKPAARKSSASTSRAGRPRR